MNRQHKNEKPFSFHTPLPEQTFMHASIVLHLTNTENPLQIVFAAHQRSESFGVRGVSHRFEFFGVRQFIAALIYSDSVTSPYRCSPPPSDKTTCIATFRNTMMVMLHLKNICFCTRIVQGKLVCSSSTHVPPKIERETIDEESCTHDIRPHTNGLVWRIYSSEPSLINLFRSIMTLFKKGKDDKFSLSFKISMIFLFFPQ